MMEIDMYKGSKSAQIKSVFKRTVAVLAAVFMATGISGMEAAAAGVPKAIPAQTSKPDRTAKQYVIAQDGTGDFMTIQEGVDHASDGDTLLICPGTYTEDVQVMNKEINITGVSKELCILRYDTAFYRKVPLTMAAGSVSNLTIYGMNSGIEQEGPTQEEIDQINEELVGDSWDRQKNYKGYAVHVDQNCLYGKRMSFSNCRIISENNHCVGIGTRGNSTISFENCELVSLGDGSCIYMHDPTSADVSGDASLIMRSCKMTSYLCPYVMTFQSLYPEYNTMYLTFQDVHVSAVAYAESDGYVPINVNTAFDVETLSMLEQAGALYMTGLSSTAVPLVHELTPLESKEYMEVLEKAADTADFSEVMATDLPEGITYLGKPASDEKLSGKKSQDTANLLLSAGKHQVIAIYNRDNQPGNGWCGLDNAYLTAESFGNTLVEMNTVPVYSLLKQHTEEDVSDLNYGNGH